MLKPQLTALDAVLGSKTAHGHMSTAVDAHGAVEALLDPKVEAFTGGQQ